MLKLTLEPNKMHSEVLLVFIQLTKWLAERWTIVWVPTFQESSPSLPSSAKVKNKWCFTLMLGCVISILTTFYVYFGTLHTVSGYCVLLHIQTSSVTCLSCL